MVMRVLVVILVVGTGHGLREIEGRVSAHEAGGRAELQVVRCREHVVAAGREHSRLEDRLAFRGGG